MFTGSGATYQARHLLLRPLSLTSASMQYSLTTLPVNEARDLSLAQTGATLMVPPHQLMLGLPGLWRQAFEDLVLRPRGITQPPASSSARRQQRPGRSALSCAAVEAQICEIIAAPALARSRRPASRPAMLVSPGCCRQ